jgi:hypothetical protein
MTMDDVFDVTRHETFRTPGRRRNNWSAVVAPTATDDETQSYQRGSRWLMPGTGQVFTCSDASAGAAIWRPGITDHGDLLGLTDDDHTLYGLIYSNANDPGAPPRPQAVWIDTDADAGEGETGPHIHDASDVWYDDTAGDFPLTPTTVARRPNETGTTVNTTWTNSGSQALHAQIDEPGSAITTDYATCGPSGSFIVYFPAWEGLETDNIRRIRALAHLQVGSPSNVGRVYLRRKAENDESAELWNIGQNQNYLGASAWFTTNPFTGAAWTVDDIANIGMRLKLDGSTGGVTCYQMYLEVEYDSGVTVQTAIEDTQTALGVVETDLDTVEADLAAHEALPHGGGGGGGGDPSGTSFPVSPVNGDRFVRLDIRGGMLFKYDGTRWLSDQIFSVQGIYQGITVDSWFYMPVPADLPIFVTHAHFLMYVSAVATWVLALQSNDFDNGLVTLGSTRSTAGNTAGKFYHFTDAINAFVDTNNGNATGQVASLSVFFDEQSGTASFFGGIVAEYKLVAT